MTRNLVASTIGLVTLAHACKDFSCTNVDSGHSWCTSLSPDGCYCDQCGDLITHCDQCANPMPVETCQNECALTYDCVAVGWTAGDRKCTLYSKKNAVPGTVSAANKYWYVPTVDINTIMGQGSPVMTPQSGLTEAQCKGWFLQEKSGKFVGEWVPSSGAAPSYFVMVPDFPKPAVNVHAIYSSTLASNGDANCDGKLLTWDGQSLKMESAKTASAEQLFQYSARGFFHAGNHCLKWDKQDATMVSMTGTGESNCPHMGDFNPGSVGGKWSMRMASGSIDKCLGQCDDYPKIKMTGPHKNDCGKNWKLQIAPPGSASKMFGSSVCEAYNGNWLRVADGLLVKISLDSDTTGTATFNLENVTSHEPFEIYRVVVTPTDAQCNISLFWNWRPVGTTMDGHLESDLLTIDWDQGGSGKWVKEGPAEPTGTCTAKTYDAVVSQEVVKQCAFLGEWIPATGVARITADSDTATQGTIIISGFSYPVDFAYDPCTLLWHDGQGQSPSRGNLTGDRITWEDPLGYWTRGSNDDACTVCKALQYNGAYQCKGPSSASCVLAPDVDSCQKGVGTDASWCPPTSTDLVDWI